MGDRLALGVDGGGSKSDAVLVDEGGNILGWGRSGSTHSLYVGREAACQAYLEAAKTALGNHRPRELWVCGLWWRQSLDELKDHVGEMRFVAGHELSMGLAMALETHGLLVLSGTGSFVGGRTQDGRSLILDGLGPMLGDYGSGYQIGLMGIRAAMASSWTPERNTVLAELVPEALGQNNLDDVFSLAYSKSLDRSTVASIAKVVIRASEDGDYIAGSIIMTAADNISDVLSDVIRRLDLQDSDCVMVASGGIAQNCRVFWDRVCERAHEIAPNLRPIQPRVKPCIGGALLALKEMGVPWTKELLSNLENSGG